MSKNEEPGFCERLREAVFEDHNLLEIDGVTWPIHSYSSEPDARIILLRQSPRPGE